MTQTLLRAVADFSKQLASSVSIGNTTATLNSAIDADGNQLTNQKIYGFTVDTGSKKEYIVAYLDNDVELSQIVSISRQGAATSGFAKAHNVGASMQITDWALLSRITNVLNGTTDFDAGTPLKYDGTPAQTNPLALATVQFVLDTASGSTVLAFNPQTIDGVVGENVTSGDWVYFKESDGKWWKTDADDSTKSVGVKIGKVRATTLADAAVVGGIFIGGTETVGTYVAGTVYYISNTAGALSTSAGTNSVKVGVGDSNGDLVMTINNPNEISPDLRAALVGTSGTPSGTNKFVTADGLSATGNPVVRSYVTSGSPHTWTKPAGLKYIIVEAQAIGGTGGASTGGASDIRSAAGAGSGGYSKKKINAADLGATETVTISSTVSSFGSHISTGKGSDGAVGSTGFPEGGDGGTATGGDINIPGGKGDRGFNTATTGIGIGGRGADSVLGVAGPGAVMGYSVNSVPGVAGTGYGSGGGGAVAAQSQGPASGGAPGPGIIILTEYFI